MIFNLFEKRRAKRINRIIEDFLTSDLQEEIERQKEEKLKYEKKKKSERKIIIACSVVLTVAIVTGSTVAIAGNHYLNKINYGDVTGAVDENLDKEEEIDFDISEYEVISEESTTQDNGGNSTNSNNEKTTEKTSSSSSQTASVNTKSGAEIQKKANADIKENIEKNDGVWQSDKVYNLLLIGYDAGAAEQVMFEGATLPRSDSIIIISVNSTKKTVKMISLSRATYVAIPDHGNKRINTAHAYGGAKVLVDTIELNYKIKIDRYVSVDFDGFETIIDVLGGVSVDMTDVEAAFAFNDESKKAGTYKMNGKQALRYVRLRKTDSDRTRTGRQRKVLKAISKQAQNMTTSQMLDFMDEVLPFVTTNFTKSELIKKASELKTYLSWTMTQDIIPHNATKLTMKDGKEVLILNWDETTEYIHSILYSGVKVKKI